MTAPKIAVIYYTTYGHVRAVADSIMNGLKKGGAEATLLQVPETLSPEILKAIHAPPRDESVPTATPDMLVNYDGILFGTPTRFGMAASQMKAFLDGTGGLWFQKALDRKTGGIFFSTGTQNGGQETTALTFLTQLTHHGMIYVPMGYSVKGMGQNDELAGGSPYGPGTLAGGDGSRQMSELEKQNAFEYGVRFADVTKSLAKL